MEPLQFNGLPKCPPGKNATDVTNLPRKIKALKMPRPTPAESTVKRSASGRRR